MGGTRQRAAPLRPPSPPLSLHDHTLTSACRRKVSVLGCEHRFSALAIHFVTYRKRFHLFYEHVECLLKMYATKERMKIYRATDTREMCEMPKYGV